MKYKIIYADPPWDIKFGIDTHRERRKSTNSSAGGWISECNMEYATMSLDQIKELPVKALADNNSVLFLWVINKYISAGYDVANSWGFKPVALLTWAKTPRGLGLGGTFVQTTEHLLFCRKGSLRAKHRIDTTWWNWKHPMKGTGSKHSRKPPEVYSLLDDLYGDLPRIELFARQRVEGWDCWGNEVESDIEL